MHRRDRHKRFVTDDDINAAVAIAYKLFPPQPRRPPVKRKQHPPVPLEVIAQELGVSRERVRQIEAKALRKCRDWCERHGYDLVDMLDQIGH